MTLKIKNKENPKEIIISFAQSTLTVSSSSQDWNNEGINNFLVKLASTTPSNEKILIEYSEDDKDEIYLHIVELFKTFINEFNNLCEE